MTEDNFVFDNILLSDFGYVVSHDGVLDEETVVSGMQFTTVKGARSDISHKVATPYEENYHADVTITKSPCGDDNLYLTNHDISEMANWLCRKEYKWFRWVDDIGQDEIWYEVQINMDKQMYGNSVIGLVLHITANRPYGVTKEFKKNFAEEDFQVVVHSDEEGYIYPDITINVDDDGTIALTNEYENRTMEIKNCTAGEIITIHGGDLLQITSSIDTHDLSKDFNYKFFRLCNMYARNKNNITLSGNATGTMTYRGIRKVGM